VRLPSPSCVGITLQLEGFSVNPRFSRSRARRGNRAPCASCGGCEPSSPASHRNTCYHRTADHAYRASSSSVFLSVVIEVACESVVLDSETPSGVSILASSTSSDEDDTSNFIWSQDLVDVTNQFVKNTDGHILVNPLKITTDLNARVVLENHLVKHFVSLRCVTSLADSRLPVKSLLDHAVLLFYMIQTRKDGMVLRQFCLNTCLLKNKIVHLNCSQSIPQNKRAGNITNLCGTRLISHWIE
jgi:hypothetical protein